VELVTDLVPAGDHVVVRIDWRGRIVEALAAAGLQSAP
jgi:hypothetical protein